MELVLSHPFANNHPANEDLFAGAPVRRMDGARECSLRMKGDVLGSDVGCADETGIGDGVEGKAEALPLVVAAA